MIMDVRFCSVLGLWVWLGTAGSGCGFGVVLHVAPDGQANAPGTPERPLGTLRAAVARMRQVDPAEERRIVVHGGDYFEAGCVLGPEDSGLVIEAAPGETPVLYGGRPIQGWQEESPGIWSAPLPDYRTGLEDVPAELLSGRWAVRWLLVDGQSRPRARYPAQGRLPHQSRFEVRWMSSTGGGWQRKPTREELTTMRYRPGDIPEGFEPANAEVTVYHMWDESVVGVAAWKPKERLLLFSSPCNHPPGAFGVREYVIWNTREGLFEPGRWYHDRVRNRLVYRALPGEDPRRSRIVAPTHLTILRIQGTREHPVEEITVRGLSFRGTTVPLEPAGFAAARFHGAVSLVHVRGVVLEALCVDGVAGQGIDSRGMVEGVSVCGSEIAHCGAGGLYVGGDHVRLENNRIHHIGLSYPSAVGIFRGGRDSVVARNELFECTYSAINYGGVGNTILSNLIYRCMTEMHDGAAIYLFAATNCIIRGNVARDIPDTGGYGSSAYYLDERSRRCAVEGNLSVGVARPLHMHMATNNVVRNNVFLAEGDARLTFPRCEEFLLEGNVLYATGAIRVENVEAVTLWRRNLFFSGAGRLQWIRQENYRNLGQTGCPDGVIIADPEFVDRAGLDLRYRPDSPARKLGLVPLELGAVGATDNRPPSPAGEGLSP